MLLPMSEYSGIPDILYPSWDNPRMGWYSLCRSVRGFLIYCIRPRIILGWGGHLLLPTCMSLVGGSTLYPEE